jgi:hypothetical protein
MGTRRSSVIVAAVVVGIIAGLAVYRYLTTVQERANKEARLVKVFVVSRDIVKGTSGTGALKAGWIRSDQINAKFRPVTAVLDINTIRDRVAVTDLAAPAGPRTSSRTSSSRLSRRAG